MVRWTFRCYLDDDGSDVIETWYEAQPAALQAKFDTRMRYLQQNPRDKWVRPYFDTLRKECAGLGEVRFEWKNVQYRPIGFASGEMEFTLVFVAEERERAFVPRNTCQQCQSRKARVVANRERACDCDFE
jgi:protoheme ferro-lyase